MFLALSVSDAAEDVIAVDPRRRRGYVTKTISSEDLAAADHEGAGWGRGVLARGSPGSCSMRSPATHLPRSLTRSWSS